MQSISKVLSIAIAIPILSWFLFRGETGFSAAADFTVNSTSDINDLDPGNGLCVAYLIILPPLVLPYCTLRAAIEETNALPGADTITVPMGSYLLEQAGENEDNARTGDLDIRDTLFIQGAGRNLTLVNGNTIDRVIDVVEPGIRVTMRNLTVHNGSVPGNPRADQGGGGIRNRGTLTLQDVMVADNRIGSAAGQAGGGLLNIGSCTSETSTFRGNQAGTGGGIANTAGGTFLLVSSTIENNMAVNGGGITNDGWFEMINSTVSSNRIAPYAYPYGGGIYNSGTMHILQGTIALNRSNGWGGGISNFGSLRLANTIVADNYNTNCFAGRSIYSEGGNLDSADSCGFSAATDLVDSDPRLDRLHDHGGPTRTHGLLIGSPAVDAGLDLSSAGIRFDQRGRPRPDGDFFDIGAFETRKRSIVPLTAPLLFMGN